jgi:hypothetical protein
MGGAWISIGSDEKYARITFARKRILAAIEFVPLEGFHAVGNCFARTKEITKFVSPPDRSTDFRAKRSSLLTTIRWAVMKIISLRSVKIIIFCLGSEWKLRGVAPNITQIIRLETSFISDLKLLLCLKVTKILSDN